MRSRPGNGGALDCPRLMAARTQSRYEARSYNEMGFWYYLGLSALILAGFALPVVYAWQVS